MLNRVELHQAIDALVREQAARSLWFMRPGWLPETDDERMRALRGIQMHGDIHAFRRASELNAWLSQSCSAESAGL